MTDPLLATPLVNVVGDAEASAFLGVDVRCVGISPGGNYVRDGLAPDLTSLHDGDNTDAIMKQTRDRIRTIYNELKGQETPYDPLTNRIFDKMVDDPPTMATQSGWLKDYVEERCIAEKTDAEMNKTLANHCGQWLKGWDTTAKALQGPISEIISDQSMTPLGEAPRTPRGEANDQLCSRLSSAAHRQKIDSSVFPAMVTRIVSRSELAWNEPARAALRKEMLNLAAKCWGGSKRRARAEVIADARAESREVQFAGVHGIIGEKGSELPIGDPRRKFKGRGVLLGNRVWNQDFEQASFADLGNAPTLLEGGRTNDAYGCHPGHDVQQADAVQAYIQAPMQTEVWVSLPSEAVANKSCFHGVKDPAVRLLLALYGHPDSPTFWEQHCDELVRAIGFEPYGPEWPSLYFHHELLLMLSIYVDDFKLAGPKGNLCKGWEMLTKVIDMDTPGPAGLYLGCEQSRTQVTTDEGPITCMTYNVQSFLEQCVERYVLHAGSDHLKAANVPFWVGPEGKGPAREPMLNGVSPDERVAPPWMKDEEAKPSPEEPPSDAEQLMATILANIDEGDDSSDDDEEDTPWYLDEESLDGDGLAPDPSTQPSWGTPFVATPAIAKIITKATPMTKEELDEPRVLANSAASIVMKVMYAARMARFDLLRPIQGLARHMTKWTKRQDQQLHR